MNATWRKAGWLTIFAGAGGLFVATITAQIIPLPATVSSPVPVSRSIPQLATPKSPVAVFREVLAMTPEQRNNWITSRPQNMQDRIEAKIQEYQNLDPDVRELRLRATELHWYLLPLMKLSPTNRAERLAQIPPDTRKIVEDRLQLWDIYPPPMKEELLTNELAVRYFTRPEFGTSAGPNVSAADRQQLNEGIRNWRNLSEDQRRAICERFDQFFNLKPAEKESALKTLPEAERQEMEKTLQAFARMPGDQRAACIRCFDEFASMSVADRNRFLKNAELWRLMSSAERQRWRDLIKQVPNWPPLPPELPPGPPGTGR